MAEIQLFSSRRDNENLSEIIARVLLTGASLVSIIVLFGMIGFTALVGFGLNYFTKQIETSLSISHFQNALLSARQF